MQSTINLKGQCNHIAHDLIMPYIQISKHINRLNTKRSYDVNSAMLKQ